MPDLDAVDLLYRTTTTPQPPNSTDDDPASWWADDEPLTAEQVEQVRACTAAEWDALDVLLAADTELLAYRRAELCDRLRALGLHDIAERLPRVE